MAAMLSSFAPKGKYQVVLRREGDVFEVLYCEPPSGGAGAALVWGPVASQP